MGGIGAIGGSPYLQPTYKDYNRISSGNKVNKAADSPADLAISEKMKTQINTSNAKQENAAMQSAYQNIRDGALGGMTDYAQSIQELYVRQANGVWSGSDKAIFQKQIDAYSQGMDELSAMSKYNESYVLSGYKVDTEGDAIGQISADRSKAGAAMNGLAAATRSEAVTAENTTAALSQIADEDMAEAVSKLKKDQLLETFQIQMQKKKEEDEAQKAGIFRDLG